MRKYVSAFLAVMFMTSSALATGQQFYNVDVRPGQYYVFGVSANVEKNENPACYAEVNWRDGSRFQLIRDLSDGELYIFFRNATWNISDPAGTYQLRANFHRNSNINGINFQYTLLNKNTIVIRNIRKEQFLPLFSGNQKMLFVMPGSIQNAEFDLTGSSNALAEISKCVDAARSVDLYPEGGSGTNNQMNERTFKNI